MAFQMEHPEQEKLSMPLRNEASESAVDEPDVIGLVGVVMWRQLSGVR